VPLITDYIQVNDIYREAAELGVALPVFCAEDRETLEAILASGLELGQELGVDNLPIIPAWTCRYPARGQMRLITACGDPVLGTRLMFSDLRLFMSENSPYRNLRVMPHLDHAFPWLDGDILDDFVDQFASVMFDASEKPFQENIRLTAEYVEKVRGKVVVEGAVDEIWEAGQQKQKNDLTTVERAKEFVDKTGVDLIVPNVGTEHRLASGQVSYDSAQAHQISATVGKILCLHGTSSVKSDELSKLPEDGFVKVNVYTTVAVAGGQAVAKEVLENLHNMFTEERLEELVHQGIAGLAALASGLSGKTTVKPKLNHVTNPLRRDAWFNAVKNRCKEFLIILNYQKFT
jgi:fructose/tagatose bisphosphate aldolase